MLKFRLASVSVFGTSQSGRQIKLRQSVVRQVLKMEQGLHMVATASTCIFGLGTVDRKAIVCKGLN